MLDIGSRKPEEISSYLHLLGVLSLSAGHPTPGLHASTKQHPTKPLLQL